MSVTYHGKTLIGEQVARALDAAATMQQFEEKHFAFLEAHPPSVASSILRFPWVSWPAKSMEALAAYFGNDGWTVPQADAREKIVDGVAVSVHGLTENKVRVELIPLLAPKWPHLNVIATNGCKIGHQSLN